MTVRHLSPIILCRFEYSRSRRRQFTCVCMIGPKTREKFLKMRAPLRRRHHPRSVSACPPELELGRIADSTRYVGSPEHKTGPSFAGQPKPRADATKCDPAIGTDAQLFTAWLREAIRRGHVGAPWEPSPVADGQLSFPRYVWTVHNDVLYEGRLVNQGKGEYKGYRLRPEEWPKGAEVFFP